jgi:hypothetical protein
MTDCSAGRKARVSETLTLPKIRQNVFDRLLVLHVISSDGIIIRSEDFSPEFED